MLYTTTGRDGLNPTTDDGFVRRDSFVYDCRGHLAEHRITFTPATAAGADSSSPIAGRSSTPSRAVTNGGGSGRPPPVPVASRQRSRPRRLGRMDVCSVLLGGAVLVGLTGLGRSRAGLPGSGVGA